MALARLGDFVCGASGRNLLGSVVGKYRNRWPRRLPRDRSIAGATENGTTTAARLASSGPSWWIGGRAGGLPSDRDQAGKLVFHLTGVSAAARVRVDSEARQN